MLGEFRVKRGYGECTGMEQNRRKMSNFKIDSAVLSVCCFTESQQGPC